MHSGKKISNSNNATCIFYLYPCGQAEGFIISMSLAIQVRATLPHAVFHQII